MELQGPSPQIIAQVIFSRFLSTRKARPWSGSAIAVNNWAKKEQLKIAHHYVDGNAKRSEAEDFAKRPEFNRMLADAKAGKFTHIVVSEQSRFGVADIWQFASYVKQLRDWGITLIEARTGNCLTPAGTQYGPVLQAAVGAIASTAELQDKSSQTLTGKIAKAQHGQWMGGQIIYGCGVVNHSPDGTELWYQEVIGGKYRVDYPDGRVVWRDTACRDRGDNDVSRLVPSRIPERVEAVRLMFRLTTQGVGSNTIAKRLNTQGYRTQSGGLMYPQFVQSIIKRGVIFTGVAAFGKQTTGKYGNHSGGTDYEMVDNLAKRARPKPREAWLTYACGWEPVVSQELYDEARKAIQAAKPRAPRHDWATYSGLLVCGGCGKRLSTAYSDAYGKRYRCPTYEKYGTHQTTCGVNQVKQEVIDAYVARWLEDYCISLEFADKPSPLVALRGERAKRTGTARLLWESIEHYMYDRLSEYFHYKQKGKRRVFTAELGDETVILTLPGCDDPRALELLMELVESTDRSRYGEELAGLEARHVKLVGLFVDAPTAMVRQAFGAEASELEDRITTLRTKLTSYCSDYRAVVRQLVEFYRKGQRLRAQAPDTSPAERREALKGTLHAIRLSFRWEELGKRRVSVLDSVLFQPQVGDEQSYCTETTAPGAVVVELDQFARDVVRRLCRHVSRADRQAE